WTSRRERRVPMSRKRWKARSSLAARTSAERNRSKKREQRMRKLGAILIVGSAVALAASDEPDGLVLAPGFHASVVAERLGPIRHLAVRGNGNIYISTPQNQGWWFNANRIKVVR